MIKNGHLVGALGSALRRGGVALSDVPALLRRVREEQAWKEFIDELGKAHHHERLEEFLTAEPLAGLGASVDLVRRIASNDLELLDWIDNETKGRHGGDRTKNNNINLAAPQGTSAAQALRRLRKDRPDLHSRVLAGEISPHRAAVEAGFRHRTATVRLDDPSRALAVLLKHFTREELLAALGGSR